jgi:copper transport protein
LQKIKKISTFIVILSLFLFLLPTIFSAHAYIKKSNPLENEAVEKPPNEVTIQFDESIQPAFNSIEVFDSDGNRVDKKNGRIERNQPSILKSGLKKNLPNGTYRIKWKVVSSDGHPVEGVIPFQIGIGSKDASFIHKETKGYTPKADLIIIRWLQYISNACYVGLLFFYLVVLPYKLRRTGSVEKTFLKLLYTGLILLFLSVLLSLPLQATIESGLPWSEVFSFQIIENILTNTTYGQAWLIQVTLLVTLTLITSFIGKAESTKRIIMWACFSLGTALLLTKALTSHASAQTHQLLTISMDFLHLFAASIWIGSLIGLVALSPLRKSKETKQAYVQMIKSFSKWGIILVLLLTFTGVFGSLLYIPNLSSLVHTNYGKILFSKVILFLLMLMLAAVNFLKGKKGKDKGLIASLWSELSIGLAILILSVVLTNLPTAFASPGPFKEVKVVNHGDQVTLRATPNMIGVNLFEVTLKDRGGQPIKDIEQINMTFTMLEMDMGKETVNLTKVSEGTYEVKGLHFSMAGNWNVHVHVLTKSLENIDTDFRVLVGSQ